MPAAAAGASYQAKNAYDQTEKAVAGALKNLNQLTASIKGSRFVIGFDGYIDSMYRMVKQRDGDQV